jgi:hypothetical protein
MNEQTDIMNANASPPEPRLRQLFLVALDLTDPAERARFLDDACGDDSALRQQLDLLLQQHKDDSFLEAPALQGGAGDSEATLQSTVRVAQSAPEPIRYNPGQKLRYIGDYELLEEIARGGMGVVYRARQTSLNRIVAVKMILGGQLATEADVKRFHTEAEAAANLQHPNIVAIHETGEHEGKHYFSMDYVAGLDLAQALKAGPMPSVKAAELLRTIAEAVHYAHQRGTLHRDLKPQNVLMDAAGQPHITDFGLAKQMTGQSDLTQTGTVMGSPSYMPPEQATGKLAELGPPADVYSLGAILYQMLTGKGPFVGATPVDTLRQVIEQEPVAPSKINDQVPPDLETICLKCLEKKPEQRYSSARALSEELERYLKHEPILARPASRARKLIAWCRQRPWALTGASVAIILGLVGLTFGLWQKVRFLQWRMAHPKARVPGEWETIFGLLLATGFLLLFVCGFSLMHWAQKRRSRSGAPSRATTWVVNALAGAEVLVSLGLVLAGIHTMVWKRAENLSAASFGWVVLPMAFAMCWTGVLVLWRFARLNEVLGLDATRQSGFHLKFNRLGLGVAIVIIYLVTEFLLVRLIEWGQFRMPPGIFPLTIDHVTYDRALRAAVDRHLLAMCAILCGPLMLMVCFLVSFWKLPHNEWRDLTPPVALLCLGYSFLGATHLPPVLALVATLWGIVAGLILVKVANLRQVTGSSSDHTLSKLINLPAVNQAFPRALLGIGFWCAFILVVTGGGSHNKASPFPSVLAFVVLTFVVPVGLSAVVGLVLGACKDFGARGWAFLTALVVFAAYAINRQVEPVAQGPSHATAVTWVFLGFVLPPVLFGSVVLFRAAIKPRAVASETAPPDLKEADIWQERVNGSAVKRALPWIGAGLAMYTLMVVPGPAVQRLGHAAGYLLIAQLGMIWALIRPRSSRGWLLLAAAVFGVLFLITDQFTSRRLFATWQQDLLDFLPALAAGWAVYRAAIKPKALPATK